MVSSISRAASSEGLWRHRYCPGRPDGGRLCGEGERVPALEGGGDTGDRAH